MVDQIGQKEYKKAKSGVNSHFLGNVDPHRARLFWHLLDCSESVSIWID